ncbi:MAG: DNA mismatch repair endonuclease MutL [Clostridia bacterium]|nr:DNA mismatch repair endonuclease MutL [Clostridia bacterium]
MAESENRIKELPKITADKIAAGEVIDRPVSIVKELFENSVDAGSTSITVEIKNGGKSYIRVTDNGSGIRRDDVELAFCRHATSKLRTVRDLDTLHTLGFRGEALASIAAVSRTELITSTEDTGKGTSIFIEGGVTASVGEIGCQRGTTVIVKDLFFNTPARLKFMKKDNAESSLIIDFVSKVALAYPDIHVRLVNNGNTLFSTPGKGDRFNAIATIYDPTTASKLIKVGAEGENGLKLEAYVSSPDMTRASRSGQIFFMNGRYIKNKAIEEGVSEAYRQKMFEGRFPLAFIFLEVDPAFVDVNIHPNKREIKFDNDDRIRGFIADAIRQALWTPAAVPEIKFRRDDYAEAAANADPMRDDGNKFHRIAGEQEHIDFHSILRDKRKEETDKNTVPASDVVNYTVKYDATGRADIGKGGEMAEKSHEEDSGWQVEVVAKPDRFTGDENITAFAPELREPATRPFDISAIKPLGAVFATYIVGSDEDTFYIIDQHAAHERVFYEKLVKQFYSNENAGQMLMLPINIEVSHTVRNSQNEWMGFLNRIGFEIEEFGPKSYAVKQIPAYMEIDEAEEFLRDFFDSIEGTRNFRDKAKLERITTRACKSAVKGNDRLTDLEIDRLMRDLANAVNPFTCPHGRPTIIKLKKTEIEALFKR